MIRDSEISFSVRSLVSGLREFRNSRLTNWLGETANDELRRRLEACEISIRELWDAHNSRQAHNDLEAH